MIVDDRRVPDRHSSCRANWRRTRRSSTAAVGVRQRPGTWGGRQRRHRGCASSTTTSSPCPRGPIGWPTTWLQRLTSARPGRIVVPCRKIGDRPTRSATWRAGERPGGSPPTWPCDARRWSSCVGSTSVPRAYREDSDFALRQRAPGGASSTALGGTYHPLRTGRWWSSVSAQRGNRDDALMRAIHGRRWTMQRGRRWRRRDHRRRCRRRWRQR